MPTKWIKLPVTLHGRDDKASIPFQYDVNGAVLAGKHVPLITPADESIDSPYNTYRRAVAAVANKQVFRVPNLIPTDVVEGEVARSADAVSQKKDAMLLRSFSLHEQGD